MSRLPFAPSAGAIAVDINTGRVEFTTRPGSRFDAEQFRKAIQDAGYAVRSITVDGEPVPRPGAQRDPPR